jgi:predicted Zn-dependent protease
LPGLPRAGALERTAELAEQTTMKQYAIVALVSLLLVACATSPTGRRQLMLVSEESAISASKEAYAQTLKPLAEEGKIDNDPALKQRITNITGRLVAQAVKMRPATAGWDWSVTVIDDPEVVNAWCMAGGKMAIYTGLVEQLDASDDEIAQVMGHEIAHALANHQAEKMSVAMATSVGVVAAGAASDRPALAMSGAALAAALAIKLPNSRTAESEADVIGIELAAKAGYDPRAAVTLWQKMARLGGNGMPQFLSTHPAPENRQQRLNALIPRMMPYYRDSTPRPSFSLQ